MAIGNREVTDLPLLSVINGSDLYAVKADLDYRVKVGGPNGLAYLDTAGRLASEFLQPNLATFDPNSKLSVANYNWNTLPNKPTYFPTDWSNVASKPAFHAVATSGNYNDLNNKPTSMAPTAHTHAAGDITSGVMAAARLGSGSPTTATFLRGDGTWATVPATTSIDWANITSKPATATRWPDWTEVTGKPNVAIQGTDVVFRDITASRGNNTGTLLFPNGYVYKYADAFEFRADSLTAALNSGGTIYTTGNFDPNRKASVGQAAADLNTAKTSGMFRLGDGLSNAPAGVEYGQLIVSRGLPSDTTLQLVASYNSGDIHWRSGSDGGGFQSWKAFWHSGNFNPATKADLASPTFYGTVVSANGATGSAWSFQDRNTGNPHTLYALDGVGRLWMEGGTGDILTWSATSVAWRGNEIHHDANSARVVKLTQAAYDALSPKNANTLYAIVG